MGQDGKQILGAHQAGGRKRWRVLRPQGAHLQLRPAGGASQHSYPPQCSRQSPPRGHQHPGAAARAQERQGVGKKPVQKDQAARAGC